MEDTTQVQSVEETPVDAVVDATPVDTAPAEQAPATEEAAPAVTVTPVVIGDVTVTEAITSKDVLASQGIKEVVLADGTRQQYKNEDLAARMAELQALQTAVGN